MFLIYFLDHHEALESLNNLTPGRYHIYRIST